MKRSNIRRIGTVLIAVMFFATACSGGGDGGSDGTGGNRSGGGGTVTLEFWHTYSDQEEKVLLEQVVPLFEAQHAGIKLKLTRMPYEGLKQQVLAAVAGDAAPDLMRMDIIWVPEMAKEGALMRLDERQGFKTIQSGVFEGPMATNFYDGGYYGVPLNTNTKVAIYNKAALAEAGLKEPPETLEELALAAAELKEKGKYGIGLSGVGAWNVLPYYWSLGGKLTNDDYTEVDGYINGPASVQALETIVDWHDKGLTIPAMMGGEPGAWDGLKSGEYMMLDDGPWFFSILMNEADSDFDPLEQTVRSLFPEGPGGSISVVGGENLVTFANSKHPDEAWIFMQWMLGEEPQRLMAETGMIPTNVAAAEKIDPASIPFIKEYVEQLNTALPRTPIPAWGEMETIFNLSVEKAVRGQLSAKDALDEAAAQIGDLLR